MSWGLTHYVFALHFKGTIEDSVWSDHTGQDSDWESVRSVLDPALRRSVVACLYYVSFLCPTPSGLACLIVFEHLPLWQSDGRRLVPQPDRCSFLQVHIHLFSHTVLSFVLRLLNMLSLFFFPFFSPRSHWSNKAKSNKWFFFSFFSLLLSLPFCLCSPSYLRQNACPSPW